MSVCHALHCMSVCHALHQLTLDLCILKWKPQEVEIKSYKVLKVTETKGNSSIAFNFDLVL